MKKFLPILLLFAVLFVTQKGGAQSLGDYKSVASGKWSDLSTWQMFDGVNWVSAIIPPSNLSGVITLSATDSIAVTDTVFADQLLYKARQSLPTTDDILQ